MTLAPLVVNGWTLYAHPLFLDQLESLIEEVEARKRKDPKGWRKKKAAKRLAAILKLTTEVIATDPASSQLRQEGTLGPDRKHWFRAKFFSSIACSFASTARAKSSFSHGSMTTRLCGPMAQELMSALCVYTKLRKKPKGMHS